MLLGPLGPLGVGGHLYAELSASPTRCWRHRLKQTLEVLNMTISQRRPSIRAKRQRNRFWKRKDIGMSISATRAQQHTLKKIWERLSPLAFQLREVIGPEFQCMRIRGFNAYGINTKSETVAKAWLNADQGHVNRAADIADPFLQANAHLLQEVWDAALRCTGERLDHIMIVPPGASLYRPMAEFKLFWWRSRDPELYDSGEVTAFFDAKTDH